VKEILVGRNKINPGLAISKTTFESQKIGRQQNCYIYKSTPSYKVQ